MRAGFDAGGLSCGRAFMRAWRAGDGRLAVPQAIERETNGLSIIEEAAPPTPPAG
jgi:hypothetical protein